MPTTYRVDISYDGSGFHGYARQPGLRTVQGELEEALFKHTGPVDTAVAGRTDAGVHAAGQVVSFVVADPIDAGRVVDSLNSMLGPEISVTAVEAAPDGFNARFDAVARSYRYLVLNRPAADPFLRHTAWHVPEPLALRRMHDAAFHLVGKHDFASFCRTAPGRSTEREVLAAAWTTAGDGLLAFEISATSFCHQMVRSLVALSAEIGRGRVAGADVPAIIAARDRNAARGAAPPHGLTLVSVEYPEPDALETE